VHSNPQLNRYLSIKLSTYWELRYSVLIMIGLQADRLKQQDSITGRDKRVLSSPKLSTELRSQPSLIANGN
jgi:hypothetical protein